MAGFTKLSLLFVTIIAIAAMYMYASSSYDIGNLTWSISYSIYRNQELKSIPRNKFSVVYDFDVLNSTNCPNTIWSSNDINVIALRFTEFLDGIPKKCSINGSQFDFALVVPDQLYGVVQEIFLMESLAVFVNFLNRYDWLQVISGRSLVLNKGEKPACSMTRQNWTVELSENYSEFSNRSKPISIDLQDGNGQLNGSVTCYPCDLPPDIFLIKIPPYNQSLKLIDLILNDLNITDHQNLADLRSSARMPFFLQMKTRSVYCPTVKIVKKKSGISNNLTCNNLRMIWDGNFVLLPPRIGIYRLILHEKDRSIEHWLGCTWAKRAYEARSTLHCSNWVRQVLIDVTEILEKMGADGRVVYGTLIGALRYGDVLPWTVDADIWVANPPPGHQYNKEWYRMHERSNYRYSGVDRRGNDPGMPMRAIPMCPMRLPTPSASIGDFSRTKSIDYELNMSLQAKAQFSHETWQTTGYCDIYSPSEGYTARCDGPQKKDSYHIVSVADRKYKTVENPWKHLECVYGKDWMQLPDSAKNDWKAFF